MFAEGRQLVLVDTPEMWDEDGAENPELVKDCLALALPGPQVFLLVLQKWGASPRASAACRGTCRRSLGGTLPNAPSSSSSAPAGGRGLRRSAASWPEQKCGSRYYELNVAGPQSALS